MKKAQITTFVILGLIILILAGIGLFLKSYLARQDQPIAVDKEFEPLRQGIEECMYLSGKEGIIKIGMQGGYINPRTYFSANPQSPTEGKALTLTPTSTILIPYWSYLSSPNREMAFSFNSGMPPIYPRTMSTSIEAQMDSYLIENTESCISTIIQNFQDKGYAITKGNPTFETTVTEKNLIIELKQELAISKDEKTTTLSQFRTDLGLNFKRIYDTAQKIITTIGSEDAQFLEKSTIEYLAPYSLNTDSELPPFAQMMTSSLEGEHVWALPEVKETIKTVLSDNINNIQVQGSANNVMPLVLNDDLKAALYDQYYFSIDTEEEKADVSPYLIYFTYLPSWEPYVAIRPSRGALIRPESVRTYFPIPMAFQKYIFYYDISYPVLIEIHEPDAFLGEGYTFQFAYEVNIRNTKPITGNIEMIDIPSSPPSLFCDPIMRTTDTITITSKEFTTQNTIPGVALRFSCATESCDLDPTGQNGVMQTTLPLCLDGRIVPERQGYFGHAEMLTTQAGTTASVTAEIERIKDVKVYIKKALVGKTINAEGGLFSTTWDLLPDMQYTLGNDEWGILTFTRIPEPGEDEYTVTTRFLWNETSATVPLVTGSYRMEAQLFRDLGPGKVLPEVRFPEKEYCGGGVLGIGEECTTVGPLVFNETFILGSISFDESAPFNITRAMTDNLTVIIPAFDVEAIIAPISDFEDVQALELTNLAITNTTNSTLVQVLMPRFG
jgi:hypothetical protein